MEPFLPMDNIDSRKENCEKKLPSYSIVLLFFVLVLLGYTTSVIDDAMPAVVSEKEAGTMSFSEERAWRYLRRIVGSGPRVAGTKYHLEKTEDLYNLLNEVSDGKAKVDWQIVSGDYWLDYKRAYVNAYSNISNLIVMLEGENTNSSILFNCHYDSVPTSPGASDNSLFCAAMVEVLYILTRREKKFMHNIIFLFNGAEENPLQGSAGFLKHPWASSVTALVNLDSAGMNCKSMLFQVTDPRVLSAYSSVVSKPSAQAFGETLFASGIVPSDTDFRVFRDFGGIYGVDIAFSKQGHVYHTRHDSLKMLKKGVIQHSGDMLLALSGMADMEAFGNRTTPSSLVYWDYLNLIMFTYDYTTAFIVDLAIVILALASIYYYLTIVGMRWSSLRELLFSMLGSLLSCVIGILNVLILTVASVHTTPQLRYLSNAWLVVPLYWMPFLIGSVSFSLYYEYLRSNKCGLSTNLRVIQSMTTTRLILSLITVVLLCVPNTATARYMITIPLLLNSVTSFLVASVVKRNNVKAWQHLTLQLIMATPSLLLYFVLAVKVNTLMLPIMGRSPIDKPDYLIAVLNTLCVILACLPLSGLQFLFSRQNYSRVLLCCSLACLVACFVPLAPYGERDEFPALQRHYWFHTDTKTFNLQGEEISYKSGIYFARTDVNTVAAVTKLSNDSRLSNVNLTATAVSCDSGELLCGVPALFPRMADTAPSSMWADFPPPKPSNPEPELKLMNKSCARVDCELTFRIVGPPHISIAIAPKESNLTYWSMSTPIKESLKYENQSIYFIYWTKGTYGYSKALDLTLRFQVKELDSTKPIVEIAFISHRLYHLEEFTEDYKKLLEFMPKYTNIATTLSSRYNYVF